MTKSSVAEPDLAALLLALKADVMASINCHEVGRIVSFDAASQTARVALLVLRMVGSEAKACPILVDVPVFVPAGGSARLTMPVAAGDSCLVLFSDLDIDNWFESGAQAAPNSPRLHSLADGFALVGFRSRANPIPDYSATDAELRNGDALVAIGDGKIAIRNDAETLAAVLDSFVDTCIGWVNTGGSTPNAATVLALTAIKTRLISLLKT